MNPKVNASRQAQQAVIGILKTADQLSRAFNALVEPHGITIQQFNVLRILRGASEPLPTMEISARMIEKTPGITGLLDRLERKGLIVRVRSRGDRRQVLCEVTERGLDLLRRLDAPVASLDEACVEALDAAQRRDLIRLLEAVRSTIRRS